LLKKKLFTFLLRYLGYSGFRRSVPRRLRRGYEALRFTILTGSGRQKNFASITVHFRTKGPDRLAGGLSLSPPQAKNFFELIHRTNRRQRKRVLRAGQARKSRRAFSAAGEG